MPSSNKPREIPSNRWKPSTETIGVIAAVTGIVGLLIAAIPLYWSYLCRSQGQYCEGSISAPGAVNDNKDKFLSRVSTPEGRATFDRLLIKERGNWLFGIRADVIAQFRDGSQLIVDSFPNGGDFEILNDLEDQVAVILSKRPSGGALASITAFFPNQQLAKRVFDIGCGRYSAANDAYARVRNLLYSAKEQTFVFDVQTSCSSLSVNNNSEVNISEYSYDKPPYGANLVMELSKNLQAIAIYSSKDKDRFLQSEAAFKACEKAIRESSEKAEGELFSCYKRRSDIAYSLATLVVFQWKDGNLQELGSSICSKGVYWTKDSKKKHIFATCRFHQTDEDTRISLEIFGEPSGDERVYFFDGKCKNIDLWQMKFADDDHTVLLELETDCREIVINDRTFKIRSTEGKTRDIYRLSLNDHWLASTFEPWATTGSVRK